MLGPMLRVLVIALVLLVAAMFLLPRGRDARPPLPAPSVPTQAATVLPDRLPLPEFALTDDSGQRFTTEDLRGGYRLVFFGFTHCPDICPLTLQVLARAVDEIEAREPSAKPEVVFVSVDPRRDTPERIRAYVRNFDPEFVGVTGPDEALAPLVRALGVTVHKTEVDGEHYNVVHNGTVYVIGPDAGLAAIFSGTSHDAETIASDYLLIRGASTPAP